MRFFALIKVITFGNQTPVSHTGRIVRAGICDFNEVLFMSSIQSPLALRPRDAAKILGISLRTLWTWNQAGIIPCARIGTGKRKIVLYSVADLQKWLAQQSQSANGGAV